MSGTALASLHAARTLAAEEAATTDYTKFHLYNTLMGVAAGVALVLLVRLGRSLLRREDANLEGYAIAFGVTGFLLTALGLHMTLTWPFAAYVPTANIEFGEGSLAFGVLLLAATWYLLRVNAQERALVGVTTAATETGGRPALLERFAVAAGPVSWFVAAIGAGMIAVGIAGIRYKLFGAPPQEPISGELADHPLVESVFISILFFLIGIGAIALPFFLRRLHPRLGQLIGVCWVVAGVLWTLFSVLNYYTHIGLIINTA